MQGELSQDFRFFQSLRLELGGRACLDLGCGDGLYSKELVERGALTVTGVDNRPEAVAASKANVPEACFFQADVRCVPLPTEGYDLVTAMEVICYFGHEDRGKFIEEARRLLAPGGKLVISFHNARRFNLMHWVRDGVNESYPIGDTGFSIYPLYKSQAVELLEEHGFKVNNVTYVNLFQGRQRPWVEDLLTSIPGVDSFATSFIIEATKC